MVCILLFPEDAMSEFTRDIVAWNHRITPVSKSGAAIVDSRSGQSPLTAGWKVYHPSHNDVHQQEGTTLVARTL
jgi:hypothetical protein